jgi:toxin YoeB
MAKKIIWSLRAQQDRKEILSYWEVRNTSDTYGKKLNELFKKAVRIIADYPHIGRKTDLMNVRVKLVKDYLLFYEETENNLIILTIWDNRRNPSELKF